MSPSPTLRVSGPRGPVLAVVLVLHGGRSQSQAPTTALQLSPLRMIPFARRIARATRKDGVATWRLRYRVRGWNGVAADPVVDARWALAEIRRRHGDVPVVLVGHSMGGRTAVHVAGDPAVCAVVALAPWLTPADPSTGLEGTRVTVVHGDMDRWTSARASRAWTEQVRRRDARASFVSLARGEHFMLLRARTWHRLTTDLVLDALADAGLTNRPGPAVVRAAADGRLDLRV